MPPKKSRPDRAEKLQIRENTDERVVKCCLGTLLNQELNGTIQEAILAQFRKRVETSSKRTHIAGLALNIIVREAFDGVSDFDLHQVPIPEGLFNQTFYYQLLVGTDNAILPFETITDVYQRHEKLKTRLDAAPRYLSDTNVHVFAGKKLLTNVKNHLRLNLEKMMKKFIYSRWVEERLEAVQKENDWIKRARKTMLFYLNNWDLVPEDSVFEDLPFDILERLWFQREILGEEKIGKAWLKQEDKLERILRYFVYINRFLASTDSPLRSLLPLCRLRIRYSTFDTSCLYGVLLDSGLLDKEAAKQFNMEHWDDVFKTRKIQGKGFSFTGTMDTDGVAATFHFRRPKPAKEQPDEFPQQTKEQQGLDPGINLVGIDPGRINIFYAVKDGPNGEPESHILTRKRYYVESGIMRARARTLNWHKGIQEDLAALSEHSHKGDNLGAFKAYVSAVMDHYDTFWEEYSKSRWQYQQLRLYGGKKRVFSEFLNQLETPGKETVVAFGSAKFAPGGKNEMAVPTTRAFKECSYRFKTVAVDEFRTTIIYNKDKTTVLKKVMSKASGKEVHGLLWYDSPTKGTSKFVNRDQNAALNIRDCFYERSPMMTRTRSTRRIDRMVGRTIPF